MVLEGKGGKTYTVADIEALPERERAELIDGELFKMEAPTLTHQRILVQLLRRLSDYIERNKRNCEVLPAPFGVYIKDDDRNYVEPDIVVVCDKDKLDEKGCLGAPDFVIEIVSPSSKHMDYERKLKLYREAGVREYWIVDPQRQIVTVYDLGHGAEAVEYPFSEQIKVGIYEDLYLELTEHVS
ncbi:MAG: Uma2 family endonuclease [Bacteroidales bacterium]|nr:Uma2 family endonuclease [Bacteroidales bacterium]MCM1414981.1 Uma2 family endonuclease [bacterium]MCM1423196.1 Uma2 family endonuclease [bacterium]